VQNISGTARGQSRVSGAISKNMDVLSQISSRNRQATAAASEHIQRLSELASQLRQTVKGFHLPDDVTATGILTQAQVAESLKRNSEPDEPPRDEPRQRLSV
jgi:twitching motility protein PilJ